MSGPAAAAPPAGAAAAAAEDGGEVDVGRLRGKREQIKELMRRDPKFIGRLITQLDRQMHKMMLEKHQRREQIRADEATLAQIDETIAAHVQPCLARLEAEIAAKHAARAQAEQQLGSSLQSIKAMEREAAALISRTRHINSKLRSKTAQAALQEARGFTATVPTTTLIRGGGGGGKQRSGSAGEPP